MKLLSQLALLGWLASPVVLATDQTTDLRPMAPPCTQLRDQFDEPQRLCFPAKRVIILTIADRKGADQVSEWIAALKPLYAGRVDFFGLANVGGVPGLMQARVRRKFQETRRYPVMMDWSGKVCSQFGYQSGVANLLVIDLDGTILSRATGSVTESNIASLRKSLDRLTSSTEIAR
jgi:hypothetical protein